MLDLKRILAAKPKEKTIEELGRLSTVWGEAVAAAAGDNAEFVPRAEHPRPQFARASYRSLNGWWTCGFTPCTYDVLSNAEVVCANAWSQRPESLDTPILVPFSPEADLSRAQHHVGSQEMLWYRRAFTPPVFDAEAGERCILHFEAVDDTCAVWCNGALLGTHEGGYLAFSFDITDALLPADSEAQNVLELCVVDPSEEGVQLRGKQKIARSDLWYTAQSGIWQPVWLETVPAAHLVGATLTPDVDKEMLWVEAQICGSGELTVLIREQGEHEVIAQGSGFAQGEHACLEVSLPHPHRWSPEDPYLYDVELRFEGENVGAVAGVQPDVVSSYCAWRKVEVKPDDAGIARFFLNDKPLFLKGVLDQGYWPESHMTAPADEAFVHDIEHMKAAGFNMLRKHIKIEADRYYYHCDRLGMLVWQDMVSGGGVYNQMRTMYIPTLLSRSWGGYSDAVPSHWAQLSADQGRYRELWTHTAMACVNSLKNHPSVVTWVLFNEGWGQFDSAKATDMVRAADPTRPIESVSGWFDQGAGDFFGVHNYFRPLGLFADRAGRRMSRGLAGTPGGQRAFVTCEFGGLVHNVAGHAQLSRSYGYAVYDTLPELAQAVRAQLEEMAALEAGGLAGYVYTQVSDVEEETNGILTYDRKVDKLA